MIKFFRRIRQRLLSENRFSKYLLYAIGEIVLVMIGILLALQVSNWNSARIDAKQEALILKQLQTEYEENLEEVNEKIFMRNGMRASIQKLFHYANNGIEGVSFDSLRMHIKRVSMLPTFDGPTGVTNEILSSGKLYIIQNTELKSHLTNWHGTTQEVIEEEQVLVQMITPRYYEYLMENYDLLKMIGGDVEDKYEDAFQLSANKSMDDVRITGVNDKSEYLRYLSDPTVTNYLMGIHGTCEGTNIQAQGLKEKTERILAIIENELAQKK